MWLLNSIAGAVLFSAPSRLTPSRGTDLTSGIRKHLSPLLYKVDKDTLLNIDVHRNYLYMGSKYMYVLLLGCLDYKDKKQLNPK